MTRPCSICSHPNRASIDRRLAANETVRALAKELGVPKSTLQRHKSVCAGLNSSDAREAQREIVRGTIALATLPSKETMAEKYDALGARIDEIIEAAKGSGSLLVAIQGLGQLRQTFDSISKLAGHTTAPVPQVNIGINIDASSIAEKLAAALGQATPKQIEAYIERSD
jgi:transcriptional regulator with XRE-family HTH domain